VRVVRRYLLTALDAMRAVILTVRMNSARRRQGPAKLLRRVRARGFRSRLRTADDRVRLQGIIRLVDRLFPAGPNCYRRALVEMAMDQSAASEPLHLGINARDGIVAGHAWLESSPDKGRGYQVEFRA
jgi:hypothetical protein